MEKESKFKKEAIVILQSIKDDTYNKGIFFSLPIYRNREKIADLIPLTKKNLIDNKENKRIIKLLMDWREKNSKWFDIFKVTEEGTKKWLKEKVIECNDRILFLIQTLDGSFIGHLGLYRFDVEDQSCELDNVIRGEKNAIPGLMTYAAKALMIWSFDSLKLKAMNLRVFSDNVKAVTLYERCGFKKIREIPLEKTVKGGNIRWEEVADSSKKDVSRYFSQYRIEKNNIT